MPIVKDRQQYEVHVVCDGPQCGKYSAQIRDARMDCNLELLRLGWRIHGDRVLCPDCSAMASEYGAHEDGRTVPE
jgi:hypothetical protein